ncbi:MAG: glycosyltransferase family 4 protein [Clostridia bacterium]|nr:glycosyltransferase family 4 protein [Clostridia bacterium]
MKKALLISNVTTKFTNFVIPSIEALQNLGYEVHMCANYSNFNDDKSKYNVKMHHIDFIRNPFNPKNIKAYVQLKKLMRQEKYDLVHCNTPIGGILGRICAKENRVPKVVYTVHGFHFYKGAPFINKTMYKIVEKWLARYTDTLITINSEDYEAAKSFKLKKNGTVKLVHGVGINTQIKKYSDEELKDIRNSIEIKENEILGIAVGELNKNKNHENIIKAIAMTNNKDINLVICGVGEKKLYLEKLSKDLGLEKQIHFLGYRNDIEKLLQISDFFIQMSFREGLPRSIMEAMACGLPCIVSEIRGNVDLIKDNEGGLVCNPKSPNDIAEKLKIMANNLELRKMMGNTNIKNIKKYDTDIVKKEIKEIYEEVL